MVSKDLCEECDMESCVALALNLLLCLFRIDSTGKGDGVVDIARTCFHLVILRNILQHGESGS